MSKEQYEKNITLLKQIRHNYKANPTLKAYGEACEVAIACIQKQIPTAPNIKKISLPDNFTRNSYTCPICGCVLTPRKKNFYCDCGQRLDWKGVL
jgi:hypothetical protein